MLCAFVHMPVKAAAQNQMLHLELRHFARYALMSNNHNIGRSVNAVLAQQLQRYQRQQHDRQQQRTTRQPQHQQQRRRNHLLLGTQELLWVREKPKPLRKTVHTHVCMCVHTYTYMHAWAIISAMIKSCLLLITSCRLRLGFEFECPPRVSDRRKERTSSRSI